MRYKWQSNKWSVNASLKMCRKGRNDLFVSKRAVKNFVIKLSVSLHLPSNQSTYSTEPRRNFNGIRTCFAHWCSIRQKKGRVSAFHRGRKTTEDEWKGVGGVCHDAAIIFGCSPTLCLCGLAKVWCNWCKFFPSENIPTCPDKSSMHTIPRKQVSKISILFMWSPVLLAYAIDLEALPTYKICQLHTKVTCLA